MRNIITIILFQLFILSTYAQEPLSFEKVIKADSIDKNVLFVAINEWFTTNYSSSKDVIQMSDKEQGVIIGKGNSKFIHTPSKFSLTRYGGVIHHTVKCYVKDNRYKVIVQDFNHEDVSVDYYNGSPVEATDFGLITHAELYVEKGLYKNYINEAWEQLKAQSFDFANDVFEGLEEKTNSIGLELADDSW